MKPRLHALVRRAMRDSHAKCVRIYQAGNRWSHGSRGFQAGSDLALALLIQHSALRRTQPIASGHMQLFQAAAPSPCPPRGDRVRCHWSNVSWPFPIRLEQREAGCSGDSPKAPPLGNSWASPCRIHSRASERRSYTIGLNMRGLPIDLGLRQRTHQSASRCSPPRGANPETARRRSRVIDFPPPPPSPHERGTSQVRVANVPAAWVAPTDGRRLSFSPREGAGVTGRRRSGGAGIFRRDFLVFYLTRAAFFDNRHPLPGRFDSQRAVFNWPCASYNFKC